LGYSISHGVSSTRSALTISNLGQHLAHTLTGSEWRELSFLFDGRLSDVVRVPPRQAGRIGDLVEKAAGSRSMNPEWGGLAATLAEAAHRASRAGQDWSWT
jgi:hypothetical protein